jgi:hypothetical protein
MDFVTRGLMAQTKRKVMWLSPRPTQCNACEGSFLKHTVAFVDGWIPGVGWGVYHISCFKTHKGVLGTGRGQKYNMKTLEKIDG